MKNMIKLTIAVITVFIAASCAPPVEISDFDWKSANAANDTTKNSVYDHTDFAPDASITDKRYSTTTANTIISIDVDITFPTFADVLRGEITEAALGFITFHLFTPSATDFTADTLSAAIPFSLEKRLGEKVSVRLTTSINTDNKYSSLIFRVDGKKYTYNHGQRLDIDDNGKIEAVYDDEYIQELKINGTGSGDEDTGYAGPASYAKQGFSFQSLLSVSTYATAAEAPATPTVNEFFFTGTGTTTNSNTLQVVQIGNIESTTTDAQKAAFKDAGDTLARGIKLQKLNGAAWTDAGSAEYEAPATTGYAYIVIKSVTFDHLATYRLIWTGSAPTESAGTYYGVKVRLYINDSNDRPLNQTQVVGSGKLTPVNTGLTSFIEDSDFDTYVSAGLSSWDSFDKNTVVKVELNEGYYWKTTPALADFKKSFQVVYSNAKDGNGDPIAPSNTSDDLVYVDVKGIEFKAEGSAIEGGTEKGKNVLYITLDPNFVYGDIAYQNWAIKDAAYKKYQSYQTAKSQYDTDLDKYHQYVEDKAAYDTALAEWESRRDAWVAAGQDEDPVETRDPDDYPPTGTDDPKPVAPTVVTKPTEPDYVPSASDPGPEPAQGSSLYFRINDDISISDNATNEDVLFFGSAGNNGAFYDFFAFYKAL